MKKITYSTSPVKGEVTLGQIYCQHTLPWAGYRPDRREKLQRIMVNYLDSSVGVFVPKDKQMLKHIAFVAWKCKNVEVYDTLLEILQNSQTHDRG